MTFGVQLNGENGKPMWRSPGVGIFDRFGPKDPAEAETDGESKLKPLSRLEKWLAALVVLGALWLGLTGLALSFATVRDALAEYFQSGAGMATLAIDVGIFVLSALDLLLARLGMRVGWLRLITWGLVGTTIYLNAASEVELYGQIAHAVLPTLWVVIVEVGVMVVRLRAGLANGDHHDGIPLWRWILTPIRSFFLWRRMRVWKIGLYEEAIALEKERILAAAALHERHGRLWRFKAPRKQRALYQLGDFEPLEAEMESPRIAEQLRREIQGGILAPGAEMPTDTALANRFGVSVSTAGTAVGRLWGEGVLRTVGDLGTLQVPAPPTTVEVQSETAQKRPQPAAAARRTRARPTTTITRRKPRTDAPTPTAQEFNAELLDEARRATKRLADKGERPVRDLLGPELRQSGQRIDNSHLNRLARLMQDELSEGTGPA